MRGMQLVTNKEKVKTRELRDERMSVMNRRGVALLVVVACCCLNGCDRQQEQVTMPFSTDFFGFFGKEESTPASFLSEMPSWLDIYREKKLVNVSTVDQVVIVTFETQGDRDEVYEHYTGKFGSEENFVSYRDYRDIISFIRDGFGVKITMLDQTRNLWSLEFHRQAI